jgi:hypothetical protein
MSVDALAPSDRPQAVDGRLLRLALNLDALATGTTGVLAVVAGAAAADRLGLPAGLLLAVGVVLAAGAALVRWFATRPAIPRSFVLAVIAVNGLWAFDSVLLLALDAFSPTTLGQVAVAVQAAGVLALALLQWAGLRAASAAR